MLRRLLFAPQWLLEVMLAFEGRYGNTVLLNGSAALQVEIRFSHCAGLGQRRRARLSGQERSNCK